MVLTKQNIGDQILNENNELQITASKSSSQNDFDFLAGKWKVHNRKLKTRLNHCDEWIEFDAVQECYPVLGGFGNVDHFRTEFGGVPFEGLTLRLFNPANRLWSLYWADNKVVVLDVPVVGSFENKIGKFYAKDIFNGKEILVQFHWEITDADNLIWSQAFSADRGNTWEWNWYMYISRAIGCGG
ncbi:MAG: hypothetical protein HY231_05680 [Acidobacteria bacterium]|nr:hypothetical protein [Acidobacteriota bacterium]